MLDDKDIEKLKTVFLTKEEAEKFETKDFVHAEFDEFSESVMQNFATKNEVAEVKKDTEDIKETIGYILTAVEGLTKPIRDLQEEQAAMKGQYDRHFRQIADHINLKLSE